MYGFQAVSKRRDLRWRESRGRWVMGRSHESFSETEVLVNLDWVYWLAMVVWVRGV